MSARGSVRLYDTCRCGHQYSRVRERESMNTRIRKATARATASHWVGPRDLPGIAIYQAITENA